MTASGPGSVALRDNYGDVHTHVGYAGRPEPSWPHRVGVVPPVVAGYQERADPAVDLDRVFGESSGTAVRSGVVSGMGGVGKTQLAVAYAHRVWDAGEVDLLVWLTATGRDAIITGYAQAGADVASPAEREDIEQVAARFLAWLAATDKRWLVVLDDLADPADVRSLWPQGPAGRVLVTTRRRDAALTDRGQVIDVDLFTGEEALAYLTGRLNGDGQHLDRLAGAGELAEELGRLPLALAQAAAYMRDRELTCSAYRRRLAQRRLELALPSDAAAGDYPATVATTWSLSIGLADRLAPAGLAHPLLSLAAELDPHGIPTSLFTTDAARTYLAAAEREPDSRSADPSPAQVLPEEVEDALSNLHRLSLLTRVDTDNLGGPGLVRVHALVQRATREQAGPVSSEAAARAAADALLQVWPERDYQPRYALLAQSLRDNTDALIHTASGPLWSPDAHPVLFRAGQSRSDGGLLAQAVDYWADLASASERVSGSGHPNTLTSRSDLASAYHDAGRLAEAVATIEQTLTDGERFLGADHPDTLNSRGKLASAYQGTGRLTEALPLFERTLTDRERILGRDHPDTLFSRRKLAGAYRDAGRLPEAVSLFERTLIDGERILGADHPDTLTSRGKLAYAYIRVGQLAQAVPLLERTLADRERILGPDHPDTLTSRGGLALAYRDAGRLAQAVPLLERTLADRERILGPDHPDTLTSRNNLATAFAAARRLAEALSLHERALADRERILGLDHPDTLISRNNLASAYQAAGRLGEALTLSERSLADAERVLGPKHPMLAVQLYRLGQIQVQLGDLASAAAAFGRAVEVATAAHGPDHPEVATDLDALAIVLKEQGNAEGAAATRAQAQRIHKQQQDPASATK